MFITYNGKVIEVVWEIYVGHIDRGQLQNTLFNFIEIIALHFQL